MRLHLFTSPSKEKIPFNYQSFLTGALHKWMGKNTIHDNMSMYSFSWLNGGKAENDGLLFENGAKFFISAADQDLVKTIYHGIREDSEICFDLRVKEIVIQEDPDFKEEALLHVASPVLIKRQIDGKDVHFSFDHEKSGQLLTETLQHKLRKVGLSDKDVKVEFDRNYPNPKTKVIFYNKIGNRVNLCPVRITGTPSQIAFAWNVGVGNSTGIGFGALK